MVPSPTPSRWALRALLAVAVVGSAVAVPAPVTTAAAAVVARPPVRVMPLGDSITVGVGDPTRSGYRVGLQGAMKQAGARVEFVGSQHDGRCCDRDHEGHSGWTTAQLVATLGPWLDTYKPDLVLLHIGTNDVTRGYPPAATITNLERIIRLIRARRPAAHIFVAPIVRTAVAANQRRADAYNAQIPGVVARAGGRTYLVPGMERVGQPGELTAGSVHPNVRGYARMTDAWYAAMRANIVGADRWPARPTGRAA
jgi:lysophospholipase L1-like esterase